jgi:hypothetical protein
VLCTVSFGKWDPLLVNLGSGCESAGKIGKPTTFLLDFLELDLSFCWGVSELSADKRGLDAIVSETLPSVLKDWGQYDIESERIHGWVQL